jgi:hypothetical protein
VTSRGTEFFEIGADEVPSAVACSKYVKGTVVKAKTRKNGNHGTTITFVFNYNHWTFFLIMAKTIVEDWVAEWVQSSVGNCVAAWSFPMCYRNWIIHTVCRFTVSHETQVLAQRNEVR